MATTLKSSGTMVLPTHSALAIWRHEITGQLSEGRWESSTPHKHWEFWSLLEGTVVSDLTPRVLSETHALKANYNLRALLNLGTAKEPDFTVRDRMVNIGRMGLAAQKLGKDDFSYAWSMRAEDLPADLESFRALRAQKLATETDAYWIEAWMKLDDEFAQAYYSAEVQAYGLKQMKVDLESIKAAMVTAPRF